MKIELSTDKNIEGSEALAAHVREVVRRHMGHIEEHLTRVEVHLADENAGKSGPQDHRCMMEARPKGSAPIAVTHHADAIHKAVDGAAERLKRVLGAELDKRGNHR